MVVRHAKSAWPDDVPDARRPLSGRGRRDAPTAGRWLREQVGHVHAVVCSPGAPDPVLDERVYAASAGTLLAVVREIADDVGSALLLGHNPGVADLIGSVTGEALEMKTSAVAVLGLTGSWADAGHGRARLLAHATPRG